ncbi:MAG: hypothetical protein JOY61_18160 [Chloroflexi bacterium]|nr:hypothetical protein [Chloroflexota bacterium]
MQVFKPVLIAVTLEGCGVIPLEPQPWFRQPRSKAASVPGAIRRFGLGDRTPWGAFRTRVAHRLEIAPPDVGADAAMSRINPLFDLFAKRTDQLIARAMTPLRS